MGFNQRNAYYSKDMDGPRWNQNVDSQLASGREYLKENMLFVRHEDFCTGVISELEKVRLFLGINYALGDLARAVELSSIQNMPK